MKTPTVILALLLATAAFAQYHVPGFQGTYGNVVIPANSNVVFPAGTTGPGVTRFVPNVVYPAGNGPQLYAPNVATAQIARNRGFVGTGYSGRLGGYGYSGAIAVPYAVPIYLGGYAGYTGYYDGGPLPPDPGAALGGAPPAAGGPQPNVIVVYPSAPGAPPPGYGGYGEAYAPPAGPTGAPAPAGAAEQGTNNQAPASSYLIAFKDHTIYSAVAYWVEGDTLHYFTTGNTHNQVSLSLVDRELTLRLNQEAGNNMQLPAN
jgi:hypothetical protein